MKSSFKYQTSLKVATNNISYLIKFEDDFTSGVRANIFMVHSGSLIYANSIQGDDLIEIAFEAIDFCLEKLRTLDGNPTIKIFSV